MKYKTSQKFKKIQSKVSQRHLQIRMIEKYLKKDNVSKRKAKDY